MLEPGRFRSPRSEGERLHLAPSEVRDELYPDSVPSRVFVSHTRPEPLLGVLQPLHTGHHSTGGLGFIGNGGTLTVPGLLFVNRCSWAHVLLEVARVLGMPQEDVLSQQELEALNGRASPEGIIL